MLALVYFILEDRLLVGAALWDNISDLNIRMITLTNLEGQSLHKGDDHKTKPNLA